MYDNYPVTIQSIRQDQFWISADVQGVELLFVQPVIAMTVKKQAVQKRPTKHQ